MKTTITFLSIAGHATGHAFRRFLRDSTVQAESFAITAAEQNAYGLAGDSAKDVPTGYVDGRFHVGVPFECRIHATVQTVNFEWILAE